MLSCIQVFLIGLFSLVIVIATVSFIPLIATIIFFLLPQTIMNVNGLKKYIFWVAIPFLLLSCIVFSISLNSSHAVYAVSLFFIDLVTIIGVITRYIILFIKRYEEEPNVSVLTITGLTLAMFIVLVFCFFV